MSVSFLTVCFDGMVVRGVHTVNGVHRVNVYQVYACIQNTCLNIFLLGSLHRSSPMIRTLSYSYRLGITV